MVQYCSKAKQLQSSSQQLFGRFQDEGQLRFEGNRKYRQFLALKLSSWIAKYIQLDDLSTIIISFQGCMNEDSKPREIDTIPNITERWNNMAGIYQKFDSTMQTFFYTLINMLQLEHAHHILEVACGTGRLLPLALTLKPIETTYLATDLCTNMIQLAHQTIAQYLLKMGVSEFPEAWMNRQRLTLKAANGEEPIESPYKFDRIIANLVLMLTENAEKMMKNLHEMSAEGCLLGVTIWGNKAESNLMTILQQALKANNMPVPDSRSNFHLYNKLGKLAEATGWEIVVQWQQIAPFHYIEIQEALLTFVKHWCKNNQVLIDYHITRINQILGKKQVLSFPTQMAILRRK